MAGSPALVPLVVFTNLDGVLLDAVTHTADAARPALTLLSSHRVPVVVASSRTRAEIELVLEKLGLRHPFIAESGAALYVPLDYFREPPARAVVRSGYYVEEVGVPYRDVVSTLHRLARQLRVGVESFSQMTVEEVARACDLSLLQARLAKLRDHAEPFRFTDATPKARGRLIHALRAAGFDCVEDGRFYHAVGRADPGGRVRTLRACYRETGPVLTVGLADRMEDLPMLQEVDIPVVVQGQAGGRSSVELFRALPQAMLTRSCGPAGWVEAISEIVLRFRSSDRGQPSSVDRPAA